MKNLIAILGLLLVCGVAHADIVQTVRPVGGVMGGSPNGETIALESAARTSTTTTGSYVIAGQTLIVYLNVTAASGTGGLQVRILGVDPASGNTFALNAAPTAVTATGSYAYVIGRGITSYGGSVPATGITATALPSTIKIQVTHSDSSSYTYSVGLSIGG